LIQHLGAHGLAETALDLGHWYLAGTETVQTQVLAGILEARRHGGFQFFGGYTGGQASFQTRRRFNRNLHNFLLYKYGNSVTDGAPIPACAPERGRIIADGVRRSQMNPAWPVRKNKTRQTAGLSKKDGVADGT